MLFDFCLGLFYIDINTRDTSFFRDNGESGQKKYFPPIMFLSKFSDSEFIHTLIRYKICFSQILAGDSIPGAKQKVIYLSCLKIKLQKDVHAVHK